MPGTDGGTGSGFDDAVTGDEWPGVDSRFRLIVVAALRAKQLLHGAHPRIGVDPLRRRNTSIALEEVKRGLVRFEMNGKDGEANGDGGDVIE